MGHELIIVGGGAAGLAAAVLCARCIGGERVLLLEKAPRVGKKLLATGNGTCNLSNLHASEIHYHGEQPGFVNAALTAFPPSAVMDFFASVGVRCTARENGRIYPLCEQASAVLDCLRLELAACGVETRCDTSVQSLHPQQNGVMVRTAAEELYAKGVLIACGGAASPSLGGSSDGYSLLTALGHTKNPLFPAIVQLRTDKDAVKAVKGIRTQAMVTLRLNGQIAAQETGEILFADYGLSGPAAMAVGRVAADWERRKKGTLTVSLDLLPSLTDKQVTDELLARRSLPGRTLEELLTGLLQKRLGQTVIKAAGCLPLSRAVNALTDTELKSIARCLKNWELPVTGSAGFGAAQVTAGGIRTAEFVPKTMESRLVKGVFAAGEVLDIDGDCGGYNLQWAWSSAAAAAAAMTKGL